MLHVHCCYDFHLGIHNMLNRAPFSDMKPVVQPSFPLLSSSSAHHQVHWCWVVKMSDWSTLKLLIGHSWQWKHYIYSCEVALSKFLSQLSAIYGDRMHISSFFMRFFDEASIWHVLQNKRLSWEHHTGQFNVVSPIQSGLFDVIYYFLVISLL